jgi:hypothetical protein
MKHLLEIRAEDDRAAVERLGSLVQLTAADMGAVRVTFRAWPGWLFWVLTAVPCVLLAGRIVTARNTDDVVVGLSLIAVVLAFAGILLLIYGLERHRVCEHGLVLGLRKRGPFVVPWESVDPGRVRVGWSVAFMARHPEIPQTTSRHRVGVFSGRGLLINGLDSSGRSRFANLDPLGSAHGRPASPFGWWFLGTRRPAALATAIEEAMVADGFAAQGLARRAERLQFSVGWKASGPSPLPERQMTDGVIGVDGPLLEGNRA